MSRKLLQKRTYSDKIVISVDFFFSNCHFFPIFLLHTSDCFFGMPASYFIFAMVAAEEDNSDVKVIEAIAQFNIEQENEEENDNIESNERIDVVENEDELVDIENIA